MNALGWTLIHSLWELAAVAALFAVASLFLKKSSSNARYLAALAALGLCVVAPVATFSVLAVPHRVAAPVQMSAAPTERARVVPAVKLESFAAQPSVQAPVTWRERVQPWLPKLVWAWLFGMLVMCIRMAGGLAALRRMQRSSVPLDAPEWQERLHAISAKLGVDRRLEIRASELVDVPAVVGLLKAVILFPAGAVLSMSPDQLESLLAHEVAHIRRHDLVVNLFQSVVESVLFYHPAVWWISGIVRSEREHATDELAIQAVGDTKAYATALVAMERTRPSPILAMSAGSGSLLRRIQRLAGSGERRLVPVQGWILLVLVTGALLGFVKTVQQARGAEPPRHRQSKGGRPATIKVQVADQFGVPFPNADVTIKCILGPGSRIAKQHTGSEGSLDENVPPGHYVVTAGTPKGNTVTSEFMLQPGELRTVNLDIWKYAANAPPAPQTPIRAEECGISGVVTLDGAPVAGAKVYAFRWIGGDDSKTVVTGRDGKYSLHVRRSGEIMVRCLPPASIAGKYLMPLQPVFLKSGKVTELPLQLEAAGNVHVVVQGGDGHPVSRGVVEFHDLSTGEANLFNERTKPDGTIDLHLPHGIYAARIYRSDGTGFGKRFTVDSGSSQTVMLQKPSEADMTTISATVVDSAGRPVPSANVFYFYRLDSNARASRVGLGFTGRTGTALIHISKWQARTMTLTVRANGEVSDQVKMPAGDKVRIQLHPAPADSKTVPVTVTLLGPDGTPSPNTLIYYIYAFHGNEPHGVPHSTGYASTGPDGTVTVEIRRDWLPSVEFHAQNGDTFSPPSVRPVNGKVTLKLEKVPLVSMRGFVKDQQGQPIVGAKVDLRIIGEASFAGNLTAGGFHQTTGADGTYEFRSLYPGNRVTVIVQADGFADAESAEGITGNPLPTVVLSPATELTGKVVDQNGNPIAHAEILPEVLRAPVNRIWTDNDGRFHVTNVPAGSYKVGIYKGYKEIHYRIKTGTDGVYKLKL